MLFRRPMLVPVMLALMSCAVAAVAAPPKEIANTGAWRGYTFEENGKTVCYMIAQPEKSEGNYTQRGPVHLFVNQRPAMKIFDEVLLVTGYTFEKDSTVKVTIGNRDFTMITDGERAWMESAATDKQIVESMKRGTGMTVRGVSSRGTRTADTYSLSGFSATYKTVRDACK